MIMHPDQEPSHAQRLLFAATSSWPCASTDSSKEDEHGGVGRRVSASLAVPSTCR